MQVLKPTVKINRSAAKPGNEQKQQKNYAHRLQEDIRNRICNNANIPNELFRKNEKLSMFLGNINCCS